MDYYNYYTFNSVTLLLTDKVASPPKHGSTLNN